MSNLDGSIQFKILGPLQVVTPRDDVPVTARRELIVLAMLLLHANNTVSTSSLIDAVWGEQPPPNARNQLHQRVWRLRKAFANGSGDRVILTEPYGYRLHVHSRSLDLLEFRRLLQEGRIAVAEGRNLDARHRYRAALGWWRGRALDGVDSGAVHEAATRLEEERVQALEERVRVELTLGRPGELIGELTDLVPIHPYRESLHGALMLSLYHAGRQADALAAYRRARELLHDELGIEPGADLQRLHQAILQHEPSLAVDAPARPPVPRQLPPVAAGFVGRDAESTQLRAALVPVHQGQQAWPAVAVIYGPAGVGKSALAIRVAHEVADDFPDGQLYVDALGSTPGLRALGAEEALHRLLPALGVARSEIPTSRPEVVALFRSVTAGRRMLVVVDNVTDAGEVAELLPGSATCSVLVTSRRAMPALDADLRLRVTGLPEAESCLMLRQSSARPDLDLPVADRIVELCAWLPLAIRIAGARLAVRPDLTAEEYAERLERRRLDELQHGGMAVRACIRSAYEALSGGDRVSCLAAAAFRALGVLHVPDVAPGVVAAMLDEPDVEAARQALDALVDAQLLEPLPGGRYRLHDLIRLVASETAAETGDSAGDHALSQAVAYYAHALAAAEGVLRSGHAWIFDPPPAADLAGPTVRTPADAKAWLDIELPSLVAMCDQAQAASRVALPDFLALSERIWMGLHYRCEWRTCRRLSQTVLDTGLRSGEQELICWGRLSFGRSEANLGQLTSARRHLEFALVSARQLGNATATVLTLNALGLVAGYSGCAEIAVGYYTEAMELAQELDQKAAQAALLNNLSATYIAAHRIHDALDAATRCMEIRREQRTLHGLGGTLNNLAASYCMANNFVVATRYADEAVPLCLEAADERAAREALIVRSEVALRRGDYVAAQRDVQRVLDTSQTGGDRYGEAEALRQHARILAAAGHREQARHAYERADAARADASFLRDAVIDTLLAETASSARPPTPSC